MITNRGKEIIAKYMLGQAPAYATHIALGCGALPVTSASGIGVSNKVMSANKVATLTTVSNHDFYPGDTVSVSGVGTDYDGTYTISVRDDANKFSYIVSNASASPSASANGVAQHDYSKKETMSFEMIRIPISSRGFVNEGGISKLALSAEMPTENRYEITEVALWSAATNGIVTNSDSKILFSFAENEGWVVHNTESNGSTEALTLYTESLDDGLGNGNITVGKTVTITNKSASGTSASAIYSGSDIFAANQSVIISNLGTPFDGTYTLTSVSPSSKTICWTMSSASTTSSSSANGTVKLPGSIFATLADNAALMNATRKARQEPARFLSHTILMRGDTSNIDSNYVVSSASAGVDSHIHLDSRNFNLSTNSPNDEIKIALSILPKQTSNAVAPYSTRIVIEFLTSELNTTTGYARLTHNIRAEDLSSNNRFIVITKKLADLQTAPDFSWLNVRLTRIYACVYAGQFDTLPSSNYFVSLDAIRFDNVSTYNPLHVMSGYSVVNSSTGSGITKIENTNNYIEFRMALGVG